MNNILLIAIFFSLSTIFDGQHSFLTLRYGDGDAGIIIENLHSASETTTSQELLPKYSYEMAKSERRGMIRMLRSDNCLWKKSQNKCFNKLLQLVREYRLGY